MYFSTMTLVLRNEDDRDDNGSLPCFSKQKVLHVPHQPALEYINVDETITTHALFGGFLGNRSRPVNKRLRFPGGRQILVR